MSGHAKPLVDEGDPPGPTAFLLRELALSPGRLGNTLRIVALVLVSVAISETFRIPEAALSAYVVLFVSRAERASTVMTALVVGIAVSLAILVCLVVFMASLSEPALRLPLIAATTFAAMFLARVSPLGPALLAGGFIVAYGLTSGDQVLGLSLQPGIVGNTTDLALPQLAFIPPEEALVHFLLWLTLVIALPVTLVIAANLLTGRDPALLLRTALAERMDAAARLCAGEPDAPRRVTARLRQGNAGLLALLRLSRFPHRRETDAMLIEESGRLGLVLLATTRLQSSPLSPAMPEASGACQQAARAIRDGSALDPAPRLAVTFQPDAAARPLMTELRRTLEAIRHALAVPPGLPAAAPQGRPAAARPKPPLLAPDALSNPAHIRFALKVTLAMLLCYALQDLTDWPGIHTCIITCFFVSLGTLGETIHKATLRLAGCVIGAALGIGTILLLMPVMTDLGDLLLVLAAVTFLAGWVASGGERTAYAGWQIALAFYLTILQGSGPTLDMQTARDRVIGIVLGNLVVTIIFATIWPTSVADAVRGALARAVEQLARLLDLPAPASATSGAPDLSGATLSGPTLSDPALGNAALGNAASDDTNRALHASFGLAISQARAMLVNDVYERHLPLHRPRHIDAAVLLAVQALIVPVLALEVLCAEPAWANLPDDTRQSVLAYHQALAAWLRRCALWIRSGTGADAIAATLPPVPVAAPLPPGAAADHLAARLAWYGLLTQDLRAILNQVAPLPGTTRPETMLTAPGMSHVPA